MADAPSPDLQTKVPAPQLPPVHQALFVQPAFIGDVILFTGLIETWHKAWPLAAIDVLVRKGNEALFEGHPFIREVRVWDKSGARYRHLFRLSRTLRRVGYEVVVNPHRFASSGWLTFRSKSRIRCGFKSNPLSIFYTHSIRHSLEEGVHEVERNHALIAPFCNERMAPKLYPTALDQVPQEMQGAIVLAPASQWGTKQWLPEKWVGLIHALGKSAPQQPVVLMGGPGDAPLLQNIRQRAGMHPKLSLTPPSATLAFASALVAHSKCVVSNDSAPLHFASALGRKAVAVYCSTVPEFGFGPLTPGSLVVQSEDPLTCRPCGLHGHKKCPEGHFDCARTIEIDRVHKAVIQVIS